MIYDLGGRKTQMVDADMGTWNYAYDRQSKLTKQIDGRGTATCLYYESVLWRLVGKEYIFETSFRPPSATCTSEIPSLALRLA